MRQRAVADRAEVELAGLAFSSATSSAVSRAGTSALTAKHARLIGQPRDQREIGERIVRHLREQQGVEPERPEDADADGRAVGWGLATTSVPRLPLAPGRLSITNDCFVFACSRSPISRMMMSGVAPAANGTTIRTGLAGHACAASCAVAGSELARNASTATMRHFILLALHNPCTSIRGTIHARVKPAMTGRTPSASVARHGCRSFPRTIRSCVRSAVGRSGASHGTPQLGHFGHGAVYRDQGGQSGLPAVLPDGRLLRTVLRGRRGREPRARDCAHQARQAPGPATSRCAGCRSSAPTSISIA